MKIILNADDFGLDYDTFKATVDCFERGALTSATIMPTTPYVKEAIEYAKNNPQFSFGVHLTFVDGLLPLLSNKEIPSLLSADGRFLNSNILRIKSLLRIVNKKQIVEETKKQISLLLNAGIPISHIDSHGHLHKFPVLYDGIKEAAISLGIKKIRKGQDVFLNFDNSIKGKLKDCLNKTMDSKIIATSLTSHHFYMPATTFDQNWSTSVWNLISQKDESEIIEIGIHPGFKEIWRKNEYDDIIRFVNQIPSTTHQFITWNDIC